MLKTHTKIKNKQIEQSIEKYLINSSYTLNKHFTWKYVCAEILST